MRKIDFDDVDIAMVMAGGIAITALIMLGADAKDVVLMAISGILALARGKQKGKSTGGL